MKTYKKALLYGDMFYTTNKLCKRGHPSKRYTKTRKCVECDTLWRKNVYNSKGKEYYKKYYQDHKKHRLKTAKQWKENNAGYVKAQNKEYYRTNKQRISEYHKRHYAEVRDERLAAYKEWKHQTQDLVYKFYKSIDMEWDEDTKRIEDKFKTFVAWKIVNDLDLKVIVEFGLSESNGIVDIYIPTLGVGVETKVECSLWSKKKIQDQRSKYERDLGSGNVLFVSPGGKYEFDLTSLLAHLEMLRERQREHQDRVLS